METRQSSGVPKWNFGRTDLEKFQGKSEGTMVEIRICGGVDEKSR